MEPEIIQATANGVATLTLNRPSRLNAMTDTMLELLAEKLRRLMVDPDVGAIVLTGAGRSFCVGGDVGNMGQRDAVLTAEDIVTANQRKAEIPMLLREGQKPTIAMIRGHAVGAGLSLALACDFRVAAEGCSLNTGFVNVGMSGDFGCSHSLTHLVGPAKARELLMLGKPVKGPEALAMGLLTRLVPEAAVQAETTEMAESLARGPRIAFHYMKRNLNAAQTASFADIVRLESYAQIRCRATQDYQEGVQAFAERRPPVFKGH